MQQWKRTFGADTDVIGDVVITAQEAQQFVASYTASGTLQWTQALPTLGDAWLGPTFDAAGARPTDRGGDTEAPPHLPSESPGGRRQHAWRPIIVNGPHLHCRLDHMRQRRFDFRPAARLQAAVKD